MTLPLGVKSVSMYTFTQLQDLIIFIRTINKKQKKHISCFFLTNFRVVLKNVKDIFKSIFAGKRESPIFNHFKLPSKYFPKAEFPELYFSLTRLFHHPNIAKNFSELWLSENISVLH